MKITVYPPTNHCDPSPVDEDNLLIVPENATLRDVYKILKINFLLRTILICTVNDQWAKMGRLLKDGDVVSFIHPVAGG